MFLDVSRSPITLTLYFCILLLAHADPDSLRTRCVLPRLRTPSCTPFSVGDAGTGRTAGLSPVPGGNPAPKSRRHISFAPLTSQLRSAAGHRATMPAAAGPRAPTCARPAVRVWALQPPGAVHRPAAAAIPWRCVSLLGRAPRTRSPAQLLLSRNHFVFSTSGRSQRCSGGCSQLGSVGQADKPIGLAIATLLSPFRAPGVSYRQGVWLRNKCFSRKPTLPLRSEQSEHSLPCPGHIHSHHAALHPPDARLGRRRWLHGGEGRGRAPRTAAVAIPARPSFYQALELLPAMRREVSGNLKPSQRPPRRSAHFAANAQEARGDRGRGGCSGEDRKQRGEPGLQGRRGVRCSAAPPLGR